ncbi:unnamed protein product, partial [Gulo gulo]
MTAGQLPTLTGQPGLRPACPGTGQSSCPPSGGCRGQVPPGFPGPGSSEPLGKGGGCSLRLGTGGTQGQAESSLEKGNLCHSNKYFSPTEKPLSY